MHYYEKKKIYGLRCYIFNKLALYPQRIDFEAHGLNFSNLTFRDIIIRFNFR